MATDKRQRQRERRELARQQTRVTETRSRFRSGALRLFLVVLVIAVATLILWLMFKDDGGDGDGGDEVVETTDGDGDEVVETTDGDGDGGDEVVMSGETTDPTSETSIDLSACPPADGSGPQVLEFDSPQPMCLDASKQYTAVFDTTAGEMRVDLDMEKTPITANNFAVLARYHYYDNTLLFRTDPDIGIIQGGSPHTNDWSDPGPGYTIPDEGSSDFKYEPGQIVMARTSAPNSASAQFFFAVNDKTAALNSSGTYVVFGKMDGESLKVAEQILASHKESSNPNLPGGPNPQVVVKSVIVEESG